MSVESIALALAAPARLSSLERTALLDSPPEVEFDRVTRWVAHWLNAPIALFSLVTAERQFFKSSFGLPPPLAQRRETPLSHSFCKHVVYSNKPLIVEDARKDPLLSNNVAVRDMHVNTYLGVPVRGPDDTPLGSLCAIGIESRRWTEKDLEFLSDMAAVIEDEIRLREYARNATELARRNSLLAREYHHRVKNSLAVASSLVYLSAQKATTAEELAVETRDRLRALSRAQDWLIAESDNVDLKDLALRLLSPFRCAPDQISVEGPEVRLGHDQVTSISLVLHELATNSAKYGALLQQERLSITWTVDEKLGVALIWDEAAPAMEEVAISGFGRELIEMAARQLGGAVCWETARGLWRVKLRFRL